MRSKLLAFCCSVALAAGLFGLAPGAAARRQEQPAGEEDRVYKASEVDEKAYIKSKPGVAGTPEDYRCLNSEGTVRLRGVMRKSGRVTDVTLVRTSGCPGFDEGAMQALRKVVFRPAKKDGRPVSQLANFEYSYRTSVTIRRVQR